MLKQLRDPIRNLEEFNGKYKDKSCFIIGSGTSIAKQDIKLVRDFVTISVNSGYIAAPWSDFFLSDDHSVAQWSYFNVDLRKSKTTVLLYEDKFKRFFKVFKDRTVFFRHRRGYHITDKYEHENYENRVCQSRTSVGTAIHVAHIMGCDPIILLGVDCCRVAGKRYFWFDNKDYIKQSRIDGLPLDRFMKVREYGYETDRDLLEILAYWNMSSKFFKEKCRIFNASPVSMMHCFEKIDFRDSLKLGKSKNAS